MSTTAVLTTTSTSTITTLAGPNLTDIWSIRDINPAKPDLAARDTVRYGFAELAVNRWMAHHVAALITRLPTTPSEARIRNGGLMSLHDRAVALSNTHYGLLESRGITVPEVLRCEENCAADAQLDSEVLLTNLLHHACDDNIKELMRLMRDTVRPGTSYHWSSCIAQYAVMLDRSLQTMSEAQVSEPPQKFSDLLARDGGREHYRRLMTEQSVRDSARLFMEEAMRLRRDPESSGWREEEARELTKRWFELLQRTFPL